MLTVVAIDRLKPRDKLFRVADSRGLCLEVTPNGSKLWRYRYRLHGKARMLSLGIYPQVPLANRKDAAGNPVKGARELRDEAARLVQDGIDPVASQREQAAQQRRASERTGEFTQVADEWLAFQKKSWATETYRKAKMVVAIYLDPSLGEIPIATLSTKDVMPVLEAIASKAPNLAAKARQYLGSIVQFAIQRGLR
ncbi:MAG: Arm DNA-binding domain-containing protein, partial [Lysobacteraceae bacterium]